MRRLFRYLFVLLVVATGVFAQAQTTAIDAAHLEVEPTYPQPESSVTVTLNAYALNMSGADIYWFVDGKEFSGSRNKYSVSFVLGELGSKTTVTAQIERPGSTPLIISQSIQANTVDFIIEPETRVPTFYKGRALPAPDEPVRVVAIPHTGTDTDPSSYTYTWRLNQSVIGGNSMHGNNVTTFTMPRRKAFLRVDVIDEQGIYVGGQGMELNPNNAEVYFYEENPLRGMNQNALTGTAVLSESETTVRAGVYNIARDIFAQNPVLRWTVDGERTENYTNGGRSITLQGESGGNARIGFSLRNPVSLTQSVEDSFLIFFQ